MPLAPQARLVAPQPELPELVLEGLPALVGRGRRIRPGVALVEAHQQGEPPGQVGQVLASPGLWEGQGTVERREERLALGTPKAGPQAAMGEPLGRQEPLEGPPERLAQARQEPVETPVRTEADKAGKPAPVKQAQARPEQGKVALVKQGQHRLAVRGRRGPVALLEPGVPPRA